MCGEVPCEYYVLPDSSQLLRYLFCMIQVHTSPVQFVQARLSASGHVLLHASIVLWHT